MMTETRDSSERAERGDAWVASLHERLRLAIEGPIVFRQVAERIDMNAETVRRCMSLTAPSVKFLIAVAEAYDVDLHWLLTGEGCARRPEPLHSAISRVDARRLFEELGRRFAELEARIAGLEQAVQRARSLQPATPRSLGVAAPGAVPSTPSPGRMAGSGATRDDHAARKLG